MKFSIVASSCLPVKFCLVFGCLLNHTLAENTTPNNCFKGSFSEVIAWCQDKNCCDNGTLSCAWRNALAEQPERLYPEKKLTVCENSCNGDNACVFRPQDGENNVISSGSCLGDSACLFLGDYDGTASNTHVGRNSCVGEGACMWAKGWVGSNSCLGIQACAFAGAVGSGSCSDADSCDGALLVGDCVTDCDVRWACPGYCPNKETASYRVGDRLRGASKISFGKDISFLLAQSNVLLLLFSPLLLVLWYWRFLVCPSE